MLDPVDLVGDLQEDLRKKVFGCAKDFFKVIWNPKTKKINNYYRWIQAMIAGQVKTLVFDKITAFQNKRSFLWKNFNFRVV